MLILFCDFSPLMNEIRRSERQEARIGCSWTAEFNLYMHFTASADSVSVIICI